MSELTREEIERIVPHEVSSGWGTSTWPLYPNHEVDKLKETALAYLDRAEEAERKHEYTLLEEAAQRNRAERAEANTTPALQVTVKSLQAHIEQLREKLSDADQRAERAEADKAQLLSVWQTHVNTLSDCVEKLEDERDALKAKLADYEGRRWYSAEMMDAVVKDRDALKAVLRELVEAAKHYRNYAELGLPNTDLFAASDAAIARAEEVLG